MDKYKSYFAIIRKIGILLSKVSHLSADFSKPQIHLFTNNLFSSIYNIWQNFDLFLLYLRVWDVRSGRSIHKLKGHKVMYAKLPRAFVRGSYKWGGGGGGGLVSGTVHEGKNGGSRIIYRFRPA